MRLRSVELQGFKTFARKTELIFEPGITAIVGPNGSGKSNLVDAIRWVLGERSARELRGARMDEVVYSGGARRPASGMAEVRLLIDNSDGRLPVPYAEVEVLRRGYRSGESDYWLNGTRCRLRDIEELLASTGLTQEGYAIVAQDDVDHIIQTSAAERRALIEEAAGVRGLHARRQEALHKLKDADISILRLNDLTKELQPRVAELRVQAELAEKQLELTRELDRLRGSLLRGEWLAARQRHTRAERKVEALTATVDSARQAAHALAARYESQRERLALAHDARLNWEREMGRLRLVLTHAESRVELLDERHRAAAQALATMEAAVRDGRARLLAVESEPEAGLSGEIVTARDAARRTAHEAADAGEVARRAAEQADAELQSAITAGQDVVSHAERLRERVESLRLLVPAGDSPPGARRLSDLITVAPDLQAALTAALGDELLGSWVAGDQAGQVDLERAMMAGELEGSVLLAHGAPRAARESDAAGGARALSTLVQAPAWLRPAVDDLLRDVWLVPDMGAAGTICRERPRALAVTRDGQARRGIQLRSRPRSSVLDVTRRLRAAEDDLAAAEQAVVSADEGLKLARAVAARTATELDLARQQQATRMADEAALQARVDALSGRAERSAATSGRYRDEVLRQEERAQQTASALAQVEAELDAARSDAATSQQALQREPTEADDQQVDQLTSELVAMEKANLEGQVALAHQEEILAGAQAQLDEEAAALTGLTHQLGPEAAAAPAEGELDWEQTQRLIVRLERQLAGLGPVNELAIDEFHRDGGRLEQIAGQLDDLTRARADLEQLATQLGAEIGRRFEAVFGAVAINFQETFGALFVGGKATLRLDDPEAEEPGVDILAQPAGKRMRSIRLLSGGERALTALAFILALEKVNPSPFYIFDEVDAPLDDANVKRFNAMLQSMAAENQFIMITHNHITMTSAQALYGVTLEDSGVSRVVSVRLHGEELVEASAATA